MNALAFRPGYDALGRRTSLAYGGANTVSAVAGAGSRLSEINGLCDETRRAGVRPSPLTLLQRVDSRIGPRPSARARALTGRLERRLVMKKLALALLAAGTLAVPAQGGHEAFPNAAGYDNRGQCQAALMHARNSLRQNPETRHPNDAGISNSEFNRRTANNWQCQAGQNGRWFARFVG